jgi:hypothetical protein
VANRKKLPISKTIFSTSYPDLPPRRFLIKISLVFSLSLSLSLPFRFYPPVSYFNFFFFLNPLDQLLNPSSNNPLPTQVVLSKPRKKNLFNTLPPSWFLTGLAWPRVNCDLPTANYRSLSHTAASHTVFCIEQHNWFP